MKRKTERIELGAPAPGSRRHLLLHRYGAPGTRPKAYLQASLHADETPAMLVAHHLLRLLDQAAAEGRITGEIVLVPYANPIGLAQFVNGSQLGRYELAGAGNFNRNWPDLFTPLIERVRGALTRDATANVALIRAEMRALLEEIEPRREIDRLRKLLAREACDADLVLDLHCDDEALLHLFLIPAHWPEGEDIAAELGCHAVLLAEESGGASFDEAFSTPWTRFQAAFPDHPIPAACLAGTVEYRGQADVHDTLAEEDAKALLRILMRRGLVAGDPGPLPKLACEATRLDACDTLRAPQGGIVSYRAALGARVKKGEVIADLIDPAAENPEEGRRELRAATDGLLLSRRNHKFPAAGETVAKIVGRDPLPHRKGYLLED